MFHEEDLINKLKNGEKTALQQLFEQYYSPLCRYALRFLENKDDAEEVVQDIFVTIWEKRTSIEWHISFKAYIYKMVHNTCLNILKHNKIKTKYSKYYLQEYNTHPHDFVVNELDFELEKNVLQAIDSLPDKNKIVFNLNRFEGLKYQEIAEKLGISIKTVEAQMSAALRLLREKLKDFL